MKINHSLFFLIFLFLCCCKNPEKRTSADENYKKGESLYDRNKYNDAFKYFYQSYEQYLAEKREKDASYSLIFLAIIQTEKGDYLGSNENLLKAAKFSDQDKILLTSIYNQFAINHNFLKNNTEAIYWYDKALKLTDHEYSKVNIKNNIGVSRLKMGNYSGAQVIFKELAENPQIQDSINFKNRIFDNYAYSKFLSDKNYNAAQELESILQSRIKRKDSSGILASLSHLADFYNEKNKKISFAYAGEMYRYALKTENTEDQLEALKKMISTAENKIKPLFDAYRKLNDSNDHIKNSSKNQFTSIIYEAEKNNADILDSKNQILNQWISIFCLLAFLVGLILWILKRRRKQAFEKEMAVKETQIQYSKKVHDVVANGLYHTMVEIQNKPELNRENVLNRIEKLYEESRDIARDDLSDFSEKDFSNRLQNMLNSYSSDHQKILIVGNNPAVWQNISKEAQTELYYVLRELSVNLRKHSEAKFASVVLLKINKNLQIKYTDNGVGIANLDKKKKSGLQNMENRIEMLSGKINFEPNPKGGLITTILIPIN